MQLVRPTPPMPVVNLHDGDRVLLLVGTNFTNGQAETYREELEERFPGVEFTFVTARQALVLPASEQVDTPQTASS